MFIAQLQEHTEKTCGTFNNNEINIRVTLEHHVYVAPTWSYHWQPVPVFHHTLAPSGKIPDMINAWPRYDKFEKKEGKKFRQLK